MKENALARMRAQTRMTRYELGRDSGVTPTTIQNIEQGGDTHISTARKLAKVLAKKLNRTEEGILAELAGLELA